MKPKMWIDSIRFDDERYPLGRPTNTGEGPTPLLRRIFVLQDERDWEKEAAKAGNPKSSDNPYYAPEYGGPDNYADIKFNDEEDFTIEYVGGSEKFFALLERTLQETKEEMGYGR